MGLCVVVGHGPRTVVGVSHEVYIALLWALGPVLSVMGLEKWAPQYLGPSVGEGGPATVAGPLPLIVGRKPLYSVSGLGPTS